MLTYETVISAVCCFSGEVSRRTVAPLGLGPVFRVCVFSLSLCLSRLQPFLLPHLLQVTTGETTFNQGLQQDKS